MAGVGRINPMQRGSLVSGGRDLPSALQRVMGFRQYAPQMQSFGNLHQQADTEAPGARRPMGGGSGLDGAASNAIQTFNFRRNFAEGGLVGPPASGAQPAPQMPGGDLQGMAQQVSQANPQVVQQLQQAVMQALQSGSITPEQLNMAIQLARAAAQNPELYPRLRQMAIENGLAQEDELPPQYDQGIVFAMLLAGEAAQQAMQGGDPAPAQVGQRSFAEGGQVPQSKSPTGDKSGKADDISINVSAGEFVIPKHIVAAKGTEFFEKMIEQYDPKNPESKVNKPK